MMCARRTGNAFCLLKIVKKATASVCIALVFFHTAYAQQQDAGQLTDTEKLFGLSKVWSEAKYNFVYFDKLQLDWDSLYKAAIPKVLAAKDMQAYYNELRQLAAYLQDGHTGIWYPMPFYKTIYTSAPVATTCIQGKVYITAVLNDTLARQGLQPGMEIVKINGEDVIAYANANVSPFEGASTPQGKEMVVYDVYLLYGPLNEPLRLTVRDKNGNTSQQIVSRRLTQKKIAALQFSVTPDRIGILTINSFDSPDFVERFDKIYPEILKTQSLVIDLRQNGGGEGSQGLYLMKHLTPRPFPDAYISSIQHNPLLKIWGINTTTYFQIAPGTNSPFTDRTIYDKRIAVLVGKHTYSAAEDFCMAFDFIKRGQLIGQPTGGSTGQPLLLKLPGGGTFRVCVRKDTYPDGRIFVGKGIQPDVYIPESAAELQNGKDPVMAHALKILKQ